LVGQCKVVTLAMKPALLVVSLDNAVTQPPSIERSQKK
jgi:hypothetical protein